jgi:hypothetical protein
MLIEKILQELQDISEDKACKTHATTPATLEPS